MERGLVVKFETGLTAVREGHFNPCGGEVGAQADAGRTDLTAGGSAWGEIEEDFRSGCFGANGKGFVKPPALQHFAESQQASREGGIARQVVNFHLLEIGINHPERRTIADDAGGSGAADFPTKEMGGGKKKLALLFDGGNEEGGGAEFSELNSPCACFGAALFEFFDQGLGGRRREVSLIPCKSGNKGAEQQRNEEENGIHRGAETGAK